jgi:hypothetical protein|nr:MAG TPA: hypothetical protein [Caudoviricetes sp.]
MATEQDKEIIRKMAASLQLYLDHRYPIEYREETHARYSFSMMVITSPITGRMLLTKMGMPNTTTVLYRMDHEGMQTPEDIVLAFQKEFRNMYEQTARYFAEQDSNARQTIN